MSPDPFNLHRFVCAQEPVIEQVLHELRAGQKDSHWMWFVFPQVRGLGSSSMAQRYAIASRQEARAYHQHTVLGARLRQCTQLLLAIEGRSAGQIFGYPDDVKFRSCMTLFAQAVSEEPLYREALRRYFAGEPDPRSLEMLGA